MSQSLIWKFFTKISSTEVKCNICAKQLKTGGGTSNTKQHIKLKHSNYLKEEKQLQGADKKIPELRASSPQCPNAPSTSSLGFTPQAVSSAYETCRRSSPSSRSRSPTPVPSTTTVTVRRQMSLFETREKVSSYERGGQCDREITNALIFMVCKDKAPHSIVEKEGFQKYTRTLAPLYKLPSRNTVTQMVSTRYNVIRASMQEKLKEVLHFSLSADICTVTNTAKSFLVVTAHFICLEESKIETLMLGVRRLYHSHMADYVAGELESMLSIFNIDKEKIVGICMDGGANMIAAVRKLLGEGKNIHCFAHILNLVVTDGLEDDNNPSLKKLLAEVKSIVTFGRQSNTFSEKLRAEQIKDGKIEGNILLMVQAVPTRWNSAYHMVKRFIEVSPYIARVLADPNLKKAPRMLSGSEVEILTEVVKILMPLYEATKEIYGGEYITGSLVIPLVACIQQALGNIHLNHDVTKTLKEVILRSLNERSTKSLSNPLLCHATLADPRFKKFYMSPIVASQAVAAFSKEVKTYLTEIGKLSPNLPPNETQDHENPLWSAHDMNVAKTTDPPTERRIPNEVKLYLQQPLLPRSCDPFTFWQQSKTCMPGLAFTALKYLCLVGSSAASERLVSTVNDIASDTRTRLTDEHISERVFMSQLDKKYWME